MIGSCVSQLWTNKGLTLLPCSPVPQDAENGDDQEDSKESRQPSKDAAALVLISARKQSAMPARWGGGRRCFPQELECKRSPAKEGRVGVGCVVGEDHLFVDTEGTVPCECSFDTRGLHVKLI